MFLLLLKALLGSEVQKVACNAMEAIKTRGHSGSEDTFELKAQKLEGNKIFSDYRALLNTRCNQYH